MDGKKLLRQKLALLLVLLAVVTAGATVSLSLKKTKTTEEEKAASGEMAAGSASGSSSEDTTEHRESSLEKDKTEMVYIKSDPEGNTKEITVETALKHTSDGADILDQSNLKEIRNTRGDEEYTQGSDGSLIWENHGEDISYKGTSDAEPPVRVKVSYYLDGEQISPAKLAGKSGQVKIRFDYENTATQTVTVKKKACEVQTPFLVMSALALPSDTFSNIQVTNGKLMNMDDQNLVIGYAMPGLTDSLQLTGYEVTEDIDIPEYVEVTADAKEFELEFTATIITPGLLEELDTDDLKDADDFADGMDDLKDGVEDLDEGVGELYDGLKEFDGYLDEYTSGVTALRDVVNQLKDGAGKLNANSKALTDGAAALQSGLEQLSAALSASDGKTGESGESGSHLYTGTEKVVEGGTTLCTAGGELYDGFGEALDGVRELCDGVRDFKGDGIAELTKLGGSDFRNVINRLRAVKEADDSYDSFAGLAEGKTGSVRFIVETEEIKK